MNMNATAQMVTTTQVGCGKAKTKPATGEQIAERFYERYINQREWIKGDTITQGEFLSKLSNLINAALAAERERLEKQWGREGIHITMERLTQELAAEREHAEKAAARAELAQIQANDLLKLLSTASNIMQTTQPFAHAWAAEDLEDRIEDWLKEVARELERLRKTLPGSAP